MVIGIVKIIIEIYIFDVWKQISFYETWKQMDLVLAILNIITIIVFILIFHQSLDFQNFWKQISTPGLATCKLVVST